MAMSCGNAHFNKMRILPENVAPSCSGLENPQGEDAPGSARPLELWLLIPVPLLLDVFSLCSFIMSCRRDLKKLHNERGSPAPGPVPQFWWPQLRAHEQSVVLTLSPGESASSCASED